jgi:hypothetical protein
MRKALFTICALFALLAQSLAAQSSSIGGLGSEIDLFMLPNWAYLVSYDNIYSFLQGTYMDGLGLPGVKIGFGKKTNTNAGQLHFYFAGAGFTLSDYTRATESAAGTFNTDPSGYGAETGGELSLQFDSLYSDSKFGAIKLGLKADGIRVDEDLNETSATDYTRINTIAGTFTPSVEYGKNFYHADGSMWTFSLATSLGIPFSETTAETATAAITTTDTQNPGFTTWSLTPSFCYVFKPKTAPVYTIYSIYLLDTFGMRFYPEHSNTTKISGVAEEGWTGRPHSYISNNFFGYVDAQHYISTSFLLRWRVQLGFLSTFDKQGNTTAKDAATGTKTETKISEETYSLCPYLGGWIGFTYQLIPSFLSLTGAVAIPLTNTTNWYLLHTEQTYEDYDYVTTSDYHLFSGIYTQFSLGVAMTLNPNVTFELGTIIDANTKKTGLNAVSLTFKYKN